MALKLQPGERIVYEDRPSWRSILGFYFKGLALTVAAALLVAVGTSIADATADSTLVLVVSAAGVSLTVLGGFARRAATRYTVTDRRLHIRRGFLSRAIQETRIERVRSINCRQTMLQRLLGVGDIDFDTAPGHDLELVFSGVARPRRIVDAVNGVAGPRGSG